MTLAAVPASGIAESVVSGALCESIREEAERFARRHELLPVVGDQPPWLSQPVPMLGERLAEPEPEDPGIDEFLAGEQS